MAEEESLVIVPDIGPTIEERLGRIEHQIGELVGRIEGHEGSYHAPAPTSEEVEGVEEPEPEIRDEQPEPQHLWKRRVF